ncbi:hypothetical protein U3C50_004564 [Providencia rettgeri]|nr:hypothetical protein [Providencia rettgeri]
MSFHDLSKESKQIARETLAEMLKLERAQAFNLSDGASIELAKFVKDAFVELETEVSSDVGQASLMPIKKLEATGVSMDSDAAHKLRQKGIL